MKPDLENYIEFPLAPMGVLAPRYAHARPFAWPPIDTSGKFSAQVFGGEDKIVRKFFLRTFRLKKNIFFTQFFIIFFRGPCKNLKPYNNPFCGFE
jgi:hypothetical protein